MKTGHRHIIGVRTEPEADGFVNAVDWHVVGVLGQGASTACGLDGNDFFSGQHGTVAPPPNARVTCRECAELWKGFRSITLRASHFDRDALPQRGD